MWEIPGHRLVALDAWITSKDYERAAPISDHLAREDAFGPSRTRFDNSLDGSRICMGLVHVQKAFLNPWKLQLTESIWLTFQPSSMQKFECGGSSPLFGSPILGRPRRQFREPCYFGTRRHDIYQPNRRMDSRQMHSYPRTHERHTILVVVVRNRCRTGTVLAPRS